MPKRRAKGEGSVWKAGDAWRGAFSYRDATGRPRRVWVRGATRREALDKLTARRQALTLGGQVAHTGMTFGEWSQSWLRDRVARAHPISTTETYRYAVTSYAAPLAPVRLSQLTPAHLARCYGVMREQGYSARTIRLAHSVIHRCLSDAVRLWLLPRNPADGAAPAVRTRGQDDPDADTVRQVYSPAEISHLLATAEAAGDRYTALWWLLATTGMRIGEACGLTWGDVDTRTEGTRNGHGRDIEAHVVHVRRQLHRTRAVLIPRLPKQDSRRTLPIPEQTVAALERWRVQQDRERARWPVWRADAVLPGLVFTTERGGHLEPSMAGARFASARRRAGLPVLTVHGLRHSYASILLARGLPITVVSAMLGHASPTITLSVYAHLIPGDLRMAAEGIAGALDGMTAPLLLSEGGE